MRRYVLTAIVCGFLSLAACAPASTPTPANTPTQAKPTTAPAAVASQAPVASTPTQAPTKADTPAASSKLTRLKYGTVADIPTGAFLVAVQRGFFKEQGIDLDVDTSFRAIPDLVPPLSTGELDVVSMPLNLPLLNAANRGVEFKVVAGTGLDLEKWAWCWILLRKDLYDSGQVKTPADLKGMKVAFASPGGLGDMTNQLMLAEGGLKTADVDYTLIPFDQHAPGFANKALAASYTIEPMATQIVQGGFAVRWIPQYKYFGGKVQVTNLVFGPRLLKDKELGQKFMTAFIKGARVYDDAFGKNIDRGAMIDLLAKNTPVKDPKLYDQMQVPYLDPSGLIDMNSLNMQFKWLVDQGLYTGSTTLDQLIDLSFAQSAAQALGKP